MQLQAFAQKFPQQPGPPPPPPAEPEPEPEPEDGDQPMLIFFGVLAIPVSILTCILLGFLAFHTYLSCSGQTTKAVVRAAREKKAAKRLADMSIETASGGGGDKDIAAAAAAAVSEDWVDQDGMHSDEVSTPLATVCFLRAFGISNPPLL
jgi:hypothetical protein